MVPLTGAAGAVGLGIVIVGVVLHGLQGWFAPTKKRRR